MGKIEKIIKKGPVEGQTTEVYPVTSTKAVYDENNKRLDNIITGLQESVSGELNTISKKIVPAINEVNTLAKSKGNGTITEVRMNGASKGTSGVVDLGTVLTEHQDISGKQDKTDNTLATTDKTVIGAINEINTKVGNLTGALTWKGKLDTLPAVTNYEAGNVISVGNKEYVLTVTGSTKAWEELGDEGSYLLKSTAEETYAKKTSIPTVNDPRVSIKMNGTEKGSFTLNQASAGEVDLGAVITAHQDISGKQDKLISGTNIKTINGESIIGSGDITINSAYPEVNHGTGDTTFTLTPNTFHVWDRVPSLTLDFGSKTSGVMNEYLFQFKSGTTATSLTLPNSIKWVNGSVPTIKPKMIYQVNILNGLANVLEFSSVFNVNNYLTIEALEDNLTATFTNDVEYAIDGDEWVKLASGSKTQPINVGQTLSFRGELKPNSSNGIGKFTINKKCNLKGNCMSMLFGDNAADNYSLSGKDYAFYKLFYNCKNIVNVSSNFLPATTLAMSCYTSMFWNCTSLTTVPSNLLPATTLADSCYRYMFCGCSSLTTAPELPATTLANHCYGDMFNGCTSLTKAPALPTTTLAEYCYYYMFSECTSLTTAPELPATTLERGCYYAMFKGCTSLITAPALPATILAYNCYYYMFQGCTSLNYIKCLATDISATGCTNGWVNGVAATGTFVQNPDMDKWETGVDGIPVNWTVEGGHSDFSTKPLTFNILSDGKINWKASSTSITKTIEYKLNNNEWVSITSNTDSSAPTINVVKGDKIQFRGINEQYGGNDRWTILYNSFSGSTASFEIEGNIMSLIYGDDFTNNLTISSDYTFTGLFRDCANLVSAENLILPATTLTSYCYQEMFNGCTSLTTAPVLPATTLAYSCYDRMFKGCTSLTTAPELPATTLYYECYAYMFEGCASLTTAPKELPATTLESYCYQGMFKGCTSLTIAPKELPATTLYDKCYASMFEGCASLKTAPELPATTLADNCYSSMFKGCASLTTAPSALPATTLANSCYSDMFWNCTSLTTAPELPATTLIKYCYQGMFCNCTSLNYIKCLAIDISKTNCTQNWAANVASNGTFVKNPNMTSWTTGTDGIPTGWTVQNA